MRHSSPLSQTCGINASRPFCGETLLTEANTTASGLLYNIVIIKTDYPPGALNNLLSKCLTVCLFFLCVPSLGGWLAGGYTRLQGGRWSDSRALSCVERFDSFSQYWTTVSSLHQARSGLGVAVLEGMIYVVGGVCVWQND